VSHHNLKGADPIATYMLRRVLPLMNYLHKIGLMSGVRDPSWTSMKPLKKAQVMAAVNAISKANLKAGWDFEKGKYTHHKRAPIVSR
jgi:hypothetical protein